MFQASFNMSAIDVAIQPSFFGHVACTMDAMILVEECVAGRLPLVLRRPNASERLSIIRSGSVFVYGEKASGIRRWTDGIRWSPSRLLDVFFVYRELDRPFPPGDGKRVLKGRYQVCDARQTHRQRNEAHHMTDADTEEVQRRLVGSLIDAYPFKLGGLVKKATTITVSQMAYHLVSYYTVDDVVHQKPSTPSQMNCLQFGGPRSDLSLEHFMPDHQLCNDRKGCKTAIGPPTR